ncbi:hypothetical protein RISK_005770 [Rhodopirellula islandica]|uniref:Uncharacterized protein n=1 Tax=Rhodopirellula islandica TaxID=595434 RepID=A0A0J1EAR9_RHOIS|nr:hypothetical protein RISK_005770 [Rhodopirellula islandica]
MRYATDGDRLKSLTGLRGNRGQCTNGSHARRHLYASLEK